MSLKIESEKYLERRRKLVVNSGGARDLKLEVLKQGWAERLLEGSRAVLELGIIVHSVVIGLSLGLGASNNTCTIKGLVAALCFHQMFEGMGLGACILQAEYKFLKKAAMAFFFAVTTPFGIALGISLSSTCKQNSPRALITAGLLNAISSGLLIYMALVDLLAADFMGPKLQSSTKLQIKSYSVVFLGAGGMYCLSWPN
ncbi:putative zinc transporter 10 [Forsythia ovata]|uniref:Zinc transporter 10 n=1 Tax=Forsythia ovata TaxID=205694 RepID=A0ABD1QD24_9LAMI